MKVKKEDIHSISTLSLDSVKGAAQDTGEKQVNQNGARTHICLAPVDILLNLSYCEDYVNGDMIWSETALRLCAACLLRTYLTR